ncbi:MAG: demethoxyubiquinone hydroxylase family protein [Burkholderiales bacterium]
MPAMSDPQPEASQSLTVLYDGACPLCRREVGVYRGLTPLQPLRWCDVSDANLPLPPGGHRADYLARFHVQQGDGTMLSGARAFIALWAALPGWRWLARLAALPGVAGLMEVAYRGFLRVRPAMQRVAVALERKAASAKNTATASVVATAIEIPPDMVGDLRSDHAGESGAVWIYHGVLAVARDAGVCEFARRHRQTEQRHLDLIEQLLPAAQRSRLLVPWRAAGFLTGALPALFGPRAVYATIAAVETFVDRHYQQQIDRLADRPDDAALRTLLIDCQADECEHRDESASLCETPPGPLLRAWCAVVGHGSAGAVHIARRF